MDDTNTYFHSANNKITYLGKQSNIEEAKQAIKDLTTVIPIDRETIAIEEGL